ncbi:MAG: hypothetical protein RL318_2364 [Fibrobacterota bacterium]
MSAVKRFCIALCTTALGSIGWWLGEDGGLMAASLLGTLGSVLGVFAGIKLYDDVLH